MRTDPFAIHQYASYWLRGNDFASQFVGPEASANHATVEDCKGLCPIYLQEYEFDPDRDYNLEFVTKCLAADVFVEHHLVPGITHATNAMAGVDEGIAKLCAPNDEELIAAINNFAEYDCRRNW